MIQLNPQMNREARTLGMALRDADPVEVLRQVQKFLRAYGEQQVTLDTAAGYLYSVSDGILNGRLESKSKRGRLSIP